MQGMGKIYTICAKIVSLIFCISAAFLAITKNQLTADAANAIVLISVFIAGSGLPIDVSMIVKNIKSVEEIKQ